MSTLKSLIVGVGASAGGLEALTELLSGISDNPGVAIVFVQHLDPNNKSLLADLLRKQTTLSVEEIATRKRIKTNTVYLCPPRGRLNIRGDTLVVSEQTGDDSESNVIDHFFHSIAETQGERGIGVILSGSGSDGTLGLKSISDAGGMTFAQDSESAKFDSMPRNAATTGVADQVMPPADIAAELAKYVRYLGGLAEAPAKKQFDEQIKTSIPQIAEALLTETGHNFKHYKTSTLARRIQRRMQVLKLGNVDNYVTLLGTDKNESQQLFRELLISVTAFFRDPESFDRMADEVIPKLFANRQPDDPVRIWIPGCATGEEAYTMAILCREHLEEFETQRHGEHRDQGPLTFQIFASDIDERALGIARAGVYPAGIADQLSEERLKKFFVKKGKRYHVKKEIRETVLFSPHNLISDPPFSRQDLISCRNLLIYLGPHLQKKLIPLFHFALRPNGFLFLGPSESISTHGDLFRPVDQRHRISQRKGTAIGRSAPLSLRTPSGGMTRLPDVSPMDDDKSDVVQIMQRIVLDEFAPKSVVIDEDGQVICSSAETNKYLSIGDGAFQNNILKMARRGLRIGLRATLGEAKSKRRRIVHENLSVQTDEGKQRVMITIQPMMRLGEDSGLFIVVFHDVGLPMGLSENPPAELDEMVARSSIDRQADAMIDQLERELATTREDLEKTMQEMETANEELKSSNEELLSMNEELQSANEELETSKEEIRASSEAVGRANADLENLLRSTRIATIFLDDDLCIRSFTPAATEIYGLIPTDTGRPLTQIVPNVASMPPLPSPPSLDHDEPVEDTVTANDGQTYIRRVLPYQDENGDSSGMVVTFTNVSELEASRRQLQTFTDAIPPLMAIVDREERFLFANQAYGRHWHRSPQDVIGLTIAEVVSEEAYEQIRPQMQKAFAGEHVRYELVIHRPGSEGLVYEDVMYVPQTNADGNVEAVHVVVSDLTDFKTTQRQLIDQQEQLDLALEAGRLGSWSWDVKSADVTWSRHLYELFGCTTDDFLGTQESFFSLVHPDDRDGVAATIQKCFDEQSKTYQVEFRIVRPDNGQSVWTIGQGIIDYDETGKPQRITGTSADITSRKRHELNLSLLTRLEAEFNPLKRPEELIRLACERTREHLGLSRCCVVEMNDEATIAEVVFDHSPEGVPKLSGTVQVDKFHTPEEQRAFREGRQVVLSDVASEVVDPARLAKFQQFGIAATCNAAFVSDNRIKFIFAAHMNQPHSWTGEERQLVQEVAQRLCVRIERAKAEAALARAKTQMDLALKLSKVAAWTWDFEINDIRNEPNLNILWGFDPDAKVPVSAFVERMDEADRDRVAAAIETTLRNGGIYDQEYRINLPEGGMRWVRAYGHANLPDESPREFLGVVTDITERKIVELEVVMREGLLRRIIDGTPFFIGVLNPDGTLLEVNDLALQASGVTRDDVIGQPFWETVWWNYSQAAMERMKSIIEQVADGKMFRGDIEYQIVGGVRRPVDFSMAAVRNADGKVTHLVPSGVDIAERVKAESALAESERQLKLGVDVASLGLAEIDYTNNTFLMSQQAAELYGLGDTVMTVTRDEIHQRFHPDDVEELEACIAKCMAGENDGLIVCEHRVVGLDGATRWLDVRKQVYFDHASDPPTPTHGVLAARDITDTKRAQEQTTQSKERLTMALRAGKMAAWEAYGGSSVWEPEMYDLLGIPTDTAPTVENFMKSIHPDDVKRVKEAWQKAEHGQETFREEFRIIRPDGNVRWLAGTGEYVRDKNGTVVSVHGLNWDITQQKQNEIELATREAHLRRVINNQLGLVGVVDREGILVEVDDRSIAIAQVDRDDVIGKPFSEAPWWSYDPAVSAGLRSAIEQAFQGEVIRYDVSLFAHGDEGVMIDFMLAPVKNDAGEVEYLIPSGIDIRDRHKATTELAESRSRLKTAMQAARMGSFVWDRITDETVWDEEWQQAVGVQSVTEKTGKFFFDMVHPEDLPQVMKVTQESLEGNADYKCEFRIIRPDGELRWLAAAGNWIDGSDGKPRKLAGLNWDVTEQKEYEQAIRLNEERLRVAAGAAGFGMFHVDLDNNQVVWSSEFKRLVGLDADENIDVEVGSIPDFVHPDDVSLVRDNMDKIFNDLDETDHWFHHRIVRKNGDIRFVRMQTRSLYDGTGQSKRLRMIVGTLLDVTKQQEFETKLKKAKRIAENANASKSQFVANMSHEIRTPMTAILGYAELLQECVADDEARNYLNTIRRNGDYLLEIINDILDLSKIEAGKMDIDIERFEPARVVEDVRSIMEVRAGEGRIKLDVDYATAIPKIIESDAKLLKQILINLVGNAVKFTKQGSVTVKVSHANGRLRFDVTDTGIGMSDEQRERLFKPFSQGDSLITQQFGGTGLGLAISQRLAAMLGGDITCKSKLGRGSTFTATIKIGELTDVPMVQPNATPTETVAPAQQDDHIQIDANILIVDDRRDIRFLSKHIITKAGGTVTEAEDGLLAIETVKRATDDGTKFDLILLDMQMPNLDGYEAAATLRKLGYTGPIIALTADAMQGDMSKCLEAGCNGYLSKPIDKIAMLQTIAEMLRK